MEAISSPAPADHSLITNKLSGMGLGALHCLGTRDGQAGTWHQMHVLGCNERFYDLNRSAPICPKCGVQWSPEMPRVSRPPRGVFGSGFQTRQPTVVVTDDDVEPTNTSTSEVEDEDEDDLTESDDETEADIEIVPNLAKTGA